MNAPRCSPRSLSLDRSRACHPVDPFSIARCSNVTSLSLLLPYHQRLVTPGAGADGCRLSRDVSSGLAAPRSPPTLQLSNNSSSPSPVPTRVASVIQTVTSWSPPRPTLLRLCTATASALLVYYVHWYTTVPWLCAVPLPLPCIHVPPSPTFPVTLRLVQTPSSLQIYIFRPFLLPCNFT